MQFIRRLSLILLCLSALWGTARQEPAAAQASPQSGTVPAMPERQPPDWHDRSELSPSQLELMNPACCGMFIEPQRDDHWADQDPETAPPQIETPAAVSQPRAGQLNIDGPVRMLQGYRSLEASERAELDQEAETVTLTGDVLFREPGMALTGESGFIDRDAGTSELERSTYVMHEDGFHGRAGRLTHDDNSGRITISNGAFSRCEPGSEFWLLEAAELDLDPRAGIGRAREVTLRIQDTPVFHYPYTLSFPISDQRMSGFLPPDISNSSRSGVDIAVPYYFNLAPHYDATITPRVVSKRGAMLGGEFRHLGEVSRNTVNVSALPSDNQFDPALAGQFTDRSPPAENRWFLGYQHQAQWTPNWSTRVDFNDVSDRDYFRDLGSSGLNVSSRNHLNQQARLRFRSANWLAETAVQRIEILDPFVASIDINKPYDRLPRLRVGHQNSIGALDYSLDTGYTRFQRSLDRGELSPDQIDAGALVTGERMTAEPSVSLPLRTPGTFLVPTLKYRYARWQLEDQALTTPERPERGVGVFSLDSGLIFERGVTINDTSYTQTLEPRLFYLYSEFEEQQHLPTFDTAQRHFSFGELFREDRFAGQDRVGDANRLSAAVTTRFIDDQGQEQAALRIGQMFHFRDRRVSLDSPLQDWLPLQPRDTDRSPLVAEARYAVADNWQLRGDLQWREETGDFEQGSISLQYQGGPGEVLNLAHRYRQRTRVLLQQPPLLDPEIRQTDISATWPVNERWRLLGRWHYDHSNDRNLESFAGVEYSNCCATMRVIFRDWVNDFASLNRDSEQNRGVYFQLSLHGLGDLAGSGISSLLNEAIPGFEEYPAND